MNEFVSLQIFLQTTNLERNEMMDGVILNSDLKSEILSIKTEAN